MTIHNNLKPVRLEKNMAQQKLAEIVGVSRNTISSIGTGQFNTISKLALVLYVALDKKFEDIFFFSLDKRNCRMMNCVFHYLRRATMPYSCVK